MTTLLREYGEAYGIAYRWWVDQTADVWEAALASVCCPLSRTWRQLAADVRSAAMHHPTTPDPVGPPPPPPKPQVPYGYAGPTYRFHEHAYSVIAGPHNVGPYAFECRVRMATNPIDPSFPDPNPERPGFALLAVPPAGR